MPFKFDPKDMIALATALITIGTVVWKGGEITAQLQATNESVRALVPVVGRLDVLTGRLDVRVESNASRIDEHSRRLDNLESGRNAELARSVR